MKIELKATVFVSKENWDKFIDNLDNNLSCLYEAETNNEGTIELEIKRIYKGKFGGKNVK